MTARPTESRCRERRTTRTAPATPFAPTLAARAGSIVRRVLRGAVPLAALSLAFAACSDSRAPRSKGSRVDAQEPTVDAFVFADERFAAVLGPLPDPADNPAWHRDRLRERLGLGAGVEFFALRLYRVDSAGDGPALADLRVDLTVDGAVVAAEPIVVDPPRDGEDPENRVLRARTLAAFSGARLGPGSGVEIWFAARGVERARIASAAVELGGSSFTLEPRRIEIERIASVIERPTRENLRAMVVPPRRGGAGAPAEDPR